MNKMGLAAIVSLAMASSGCAVAVGAGAGVGAYRSIKNRSASNESINSMTFPAYKITKLTLCQSVDTQCTDVYVDKRTPMDVKKPVRYEDGWMVSRNVTPDGMLDQICWMNGDTVDKGSCKTMDKMKARDAEAWQKRFEEVKEVYAQQK